MATPRAYLKSIVQTVGDISKLKDEQLEKYRRNLRRIDDTLDELYDDIEADIEESEQS